MTLNDKYYIETQNKLASKDQNEVLKTLKEIKHSGKSLIIPLIIALLKDKKENDITKEVLVLLGQLKDKEAIPIILEEIKSKDTEAFKAELIMTCWQSGLDYGYYIIDFAEEFIKGDFRVAIEAFTVIEEWIHNSPKEIILGCKKYLVENIGRISDEKKAYYLELVKLVESYL
jgi:hypothetical protein